VERQVLTEKELAKFLKVSAETVRYWRKARRGPRYSKLGRAVRYTSDAIDEFLAHNSHAPARASKGR
jgi:predicted DNA-binding transcriptional regulator AlpA